MKTAVAIAFRNADARNNPERGQNAVLHAENDFANAAALFERAPLLRIGNARPHLLPAGNVDDDIVDRRR